jgi:ABC-type multidrug transport system fused ATPase/permease subunit
MYMPCHKLTQNEKRRGKMSDVEIGVKERISILTTEYNSLRSDINARMSSMFQLSAFFVAVTALLFQNSSGQRIFVIGGLALLAYLVGLVLLFHDMVQAGRRVQQLEAEINKRASEKLLVWETELGGISHGYWRWPSRP